MKSKITTILLLLIFVLSCQQKQRNQSQDNQIEDSEFNRNRQVWRTSGITNYRMTVDLQKPGHATPNGKFVITVREGKADSIKLADNLEPVSEYVRFGNYRTLDEIFQYIEQLEKANRVWDKREIEYDAKLGYPKRVNLDQARVHDEEIFFEVLQFEVLR